MNVLCFVDTLSRAIMCGYTKLFVHVNYIPAKQVMDHLSIITVINSIVTFFPTINKHVTRVVYTQVIHPKTPANQIK